MRQPARRTSALLGVLSAAFLLAACGDSTSPRVRPKPITGSFELRLVDEQPLPVTTRLSYGGGADFTVRWGGATFSSEPAPGGDGWLSLALNGDLPGNPAVALESETVYSQPVADSVITTQGAGRIRGDTLLFRTTATSTFGAHEWRYARAAGR
jgi:hypothetical protein